MSTHRTTYRPAKDVEPRIPAGRDWPRLALWSVSQIVLFLVLFQAYKVVRKTFVSGDQVTAAYRNANDILDFQGWLGLNFELGWQAWVLDQGDWLITSFNNFYAYYMYAFYAFAIILLIVAPLRYRYLRRVFIISMIVALPWYALYPLAPPRFMTEYGFIDTLAVYGPNYFREGGVVSANRFAAMPSMHCGWSMIAGFMIAAAFPVRWRWLGRGLGLAFALAMSVTVIVTGNHYWMDVVGGWAVVVVSLVIHRYLPYPLPLPGSWRRDSTSTVPNADIEPSRM